MRIPFKASKPLKPFQGLKHLDMIISLGCRVCFKASKTLSGIETCLRIDNGLTRWSFKASKTLSGIETLILLRSISKIGSFKASKTLSGIETNLLPLLLWSLAASKPLKPFQGLKLNARIADAAASALQSL